MLEARDLDQLAHAAMTTTCAAAAVTHRRSSSAVFTGRCAHRLAENTTPGGSGAQNPNRKVQGTSAPPLKGDAVTLPATPAAPRR